MSDFDELGEFLSTTKADDGRTPYQKELRTQMLVTASDLIDHEDEPAELGFEPDNKYLSFQIIGEQDWPDVRRHQLWKQRFYVISPRGVIGLVPWPGSRIVWPWDAGWTVDSHKEKVDSLLKEEKKK